jgi:hypothetical protein
MNWRTLMQVIGSLSEEELKRMIDEEMRGKKRAMFVQRLHQRYCMKRAAREREALMEQLK